MFAELAAIAGLTVLIMISPGPDFALVTRNALLAGNAAGAWTSIGILTGNLIHLSYCLLGIGWLIATSIIAFTVLKLAGGALDRPSAWRSIDRVGACVSGCRKHRTCVRLLVPTPKDYRSRIAGWVSQQARCRTRNPSSWRRCRRACGRGS